MCKISDDDDECPNVYEVDYNVCPDMCEVGDNDACTDVCEVGDAVGTNGECTNICGDGCSFGLSLPKVGSKQSLSSCLNVLGGVRKKMTYSLYSLYKR